MDKFDRIYALHNLFSSHRYPVSKQTIMDKLECGEATVKRIIRTLRDELGAPVFNVRGEGWRYDPTQEFELPGVWFNRKELEALLAMDRLLSNVGSGLLDKELEPLRKRLSGLLSRISPSAETEVARIRILDMGRRFTELPHFSHVVEAVLERTRLIFNYSARSSGCSQRREVSPQRLVHYRNNWYLDGLCHLRNGLRTFALDCISNIERSDEQCMDISEEELNEHLGTSYGIFSGKADKLALLRFSPERARWVSAETWHPEQKGTWQEDGGYELRLPYFNPTELILDICRYGPDVQVIEPDELREAVTERLRRAADQYN
ncbi:helix-turn-helix transcriptional regulator [Mariprofundus ferrooxydans]|uniref:helix-turn-helix transcriptional regulator n=1 Tax=Mariprofundus ferrooxydans TaxID=314344 RepID=UPI0003A73522|nr:WYL domain-containing protein [Mariprofundus ferrooxydans]